MRESSHDLRSLPRIAFDDVAPAPVRVAKPRASGTAGNGQQPRTSNGGGARPPAAAPAQPRAAPAQPAAARNGQAPRAAAAVATVAAPVEAVSAGAPKKGMFGGIMSALVLQQSG